MTGEKFATQEQLFERIDELDDRVSLWEAGDPEASSAILDELGFLRDFWPPDENRELAKDTCNRVARLILLFEHRLEGDFEQVRQALTAAVDLLHVLAGDGRRIDDSLRRLQEATLGGPARTAPERGGEPAHAAARPRTPPAAAGDAPSPAAGEGALFAGDRGFLADFVSEAAEHLEEIDSLLLDLEKSSGSAEMLHGLFRCFHTVKGVADFLGLADISSLAHSVESLLDRHREKRLACGSPTLDLLFEATDLLRSLVGSVRESIAGDVPIERDSRVPEVIGRLEKAAASATGGAPAARVRPEPTRDRRVGASAASSTTSPAARPEAGVDGPRNAAPSPPAGAGAGPAASGRPERESVPAQEAASGLSATVKVDSRRLDLLLDTIGELVVAVSVANQAARRDGEAEAIARTQVDKLTRALQELGTSLRMIPLLSTFRKMTRLSRDLGKRCGKSLQFNFSGEGTELDRTIVQQIQDPLLHILRNAIDHGIETTEERVDAGKPKVAAVSARAYHKGGSFFIEVADDGRGFDPDLILRKARAMGLVSDGREPSRQEILHLVFEPGFSTAERVTSISGRGVGMDVVKRTVEKLGGNVDLESVPGKGTVITLRLPLTVAMIEGMVIRVGGQRFIVPTLALTRVHRPQPGEIKTVSQREEFLSLKERFIPIVRLGRFFEIESDGDETAAGVVILVEGKGRPVGLLVDELLGQQQIVIKGLGRALQNAPGIAGGAVMQDGKVGLILDVQGILEMAHSGRGARLRAVG